MSEKQPLPPDLRDAVDAEPSEWLRTRLLEKLDGHPEKWDWKPQPTASVATPQGRPPRSQNVTKRPKVTVRSVPCQYEGVVLERWRSDCPARVVQLSVRACNHPDDPGRCSRADDKRHMIDGVRICYGRGCPLRGED